MTAAQVADAQAVRKVLAVEPSLRGLELAASAVSLGRKELLHAGPPLRDGAAVCRPVLHSAITAALFEGWAHSAQEAEERLRSGDIRFRAAQDVGCVVPLADVVSASMWLQAVKDASGSAVCWSPINGGIEHVLRVGVLGDDVLAHLRWLNGPFADAYAQAFTEPVPLLELADDGLAAGDDCHGRTGAATAALLAVLQERVAGPSGALVEQFLQRSPSFFLNIWMAASKLMLAAAQGVEGSAVVTAAAGNGVDFGIQVAALPDRWFTAPAAPPAVSPSSLGDAEPLGAIGDSAVVDMLGLGAMTALPQGGVAAMPAFVDDVDDLGALLHASHPRMRRTRARMVISAQSIVASGTAPVIGLGVLDKAGRRGRLAGGYYRPPVELFARASAASRA